ncbi:hypothetical protein [Amycolatopsis plumensis]|uniref:HNH endonuclease n=1 Tax=Amycolatopsis plumensis TaxID=236508 RepID=A0ABV5U8E2_9PSEU
MSESRCRKFVPVRSSGVCEICGQHRAESLHHRKGRGQGGPWQPSNIVHLCGDGTTGCHGLVTNKRAEHYDRGWLVHPTADPALTPFDHWLWGPVYLDDLGDYHQRKPALEAS